MTKSLQSTSPQTWQYQENKALRLLKSLKALLKILGPGFITGASDDDPSGIATYAQTGAIFGYSQL
jgi:Mn2+/Fe2+ NRAMP family transporter